MEEMELEILRKATEMFNRYGLRPVTMDDIAREMSISKKTLYKYFSNKEDLVRKAVMAMFEEIRGNMDQLLEHSGNAIDMLFAMDNVVCTTIERHDPSMQFQLDRYYPEVSAMLESLKKEQVFKMMYNNIKKGKAEGLYRPELDAEVVTFLYYSRAQLMMEEDMGPFKDRPIDQVMREILIYHVRGVASPKGIEYLEQKLKTPNT